MQCISLLKICLLSIFAGKHSCANVQRWLKHSLVPWIWFTMREVSWKNSFIRNKATGSNWCKVQFIFMCFCNLKGRIISHYRLLYMVLWKWAMHMQFMQRRNSKLTQKGDVKFYANSNLRLLRYFSMKVAYTVWIGWTCNFLISFILIIVKNCQWMSLNKYLSLN